MFKPTEVWGPHWYYDAKGVTSDILADPAFSIAQTIIGVATRDLLMIISDGPKTQPNDLHVVRGVLARLLAKAADQPAFNIYALEHGFQAIPSETIRTYALAALQDYASLTGLLHALEIEWISQPRGGEIPQYFYQLPEQTYQSEYFKVIQQINMWKTQGFKIGVFQGAFDPPTPSHLAIATNCFMWAQSKGIPLKLIWMFDNNQLIKRKGPDRPRFSDMEKKQSTVQNFWNVSSTVESCVMDQKDLYQYIWEYGQLGTDYVFITEEVKDIKTRKWTANQAGAELVVVPYIFGASHSTDIMVRRDEHISFIANR